MLLLGIQDGTAGRLPKIGAGALNQPQEQQEQQGVWEGNAHELSTRTQMARSQAHGRRCERYPCTAPDIPSQRQVDRARSALSPLRYDGTMDALKASALASPLGPEGFAMPCEALFTCRRRDAAAWRQLAPVHDANSISLKKGALGQPARKVRRNSRTDRKVKQCTMA
jgi:hypothetical protein